MCTLNCACELHVYTIKTCLKSENNIYPMVGPVHACLSATLGLHGYILGMGMGMGMYCI